MIQPLETVFVTLEVWNLRTENSILYSRNLHFGGEKEEGNCWYFSVRKNNNQNEKVRVQYIGRGGGVVVICAQSRTISVKILEKISAEDQACIDSLVWNSKF